MDWPDKSHVIGTQSLLLSPQVCISRQREASEPGLKALHSFMRCEQLARVSPPTPMACPSILHIGMCKHTAVTENSSPYYACPIWCSDAFLHPFGLLILKANRLSASFLLHSRLREIARISHADANRMQFNRGPTHKQQKNLIILIMTIYFQSLLWKKK